MDAAIKSEKSDTYLNHQRGPENQKIIRRYIFITFGLLCMFSIQILTVSFLYIRNEKNVTSYQNYSFITENGHLRQFVQSVKYTDTCDYSLNNYNGKVICCSWICYVAYDRYMKTMVECWRSGLLYCEINSTVLSLDLMKKLHINHNVSTLSIYSSILEEICDNTFNFEPFLKLATITLQLKGLKFLHKSSFNGLKQLSYFSLQEASSIVYVESGILSPMEKSLAVIQIQSLQSRAAEIIKNFTGVPTIKMVQLKIVDFSQNNLIAINNDTFASMTAAQSLYLHFSNISYIHPHAFQTTIKTLIQIFLHDNSLQYLSSDIFLNQKQLKNVTLAGNPWRCDCSLGWLKNLEQNFHRVSDEPYCSSPLKNKGKSFSQATFCSECDSTMASLDDNHSTSCFKTTEMTKITTETVHNNYTSTSSEATSFTISTSEHANPTTDTLTASDSNDMSDKDMSTEKPDMTKSSEVTEFDVSSSHSSHITSTPQHSTNNNGKSSTTSTTVSNVDDTNITIIWCQDYLTQTYKQIGIRSFTLLEIIPTNALDFNPENEEFFIVDEIDNEENVEVVIQVPNNSTIIWMSHTEDDQMPHCLLGLNNKISITLYQHDQDYMFCMLKDSVISPFHCLAHKTMQIFDERPWIKNKDRDIFISASIGILIVTLVFGIIGVYVFIKRYPKLIRGKRVLVVKHRIADVLILPKQIDDTQFSDENVLPLSNDDNIYSQKTKINGADGTCSSTSSYVTVNEPTPIDLIAFRFEQTINKLKGIKNMNEAKCD